MPFNDFVGNLILLPVGGNEITRNSPSHTIVVLSKNPTSGMQSEPIPTCSRPPAEFIRFASPVLHMRRTATADVEIGGTAVARGDKVVICYISGNRDDAVFVDPDRFDVRRKPVSHVGFGAGQHVCVGSKLAEIQLRSAFRQLARHVRRFEVEGEPRRFRSNFINGFKNLDVRKIPA